jgi:hypothetical protein
MKKLIVFFLILIAADVRAAYGDSTGFVNRCYFSDNGEMALVSELTYMGWNNKSIPVFGWYTAGKNKPGNYVGISDDSVYCYRQDSATFSLIIDSSFAKQTFFEKYHFNRQGEDVTDELHFHIGKKFLGKENTVKLLRLDEVAQTTGRKFTAADTRFFNYFIRFEWKDIVVFKDTLLHVYAGKNRLYEGLKETRLVHIYDPVSGWLRGTAGYGTRLYMDKACRRFFLKAKYDISNPVKITVISWPKGTVDNIQEIQELRMLGTF